MSHVDYFFDLVRLEIVIWNRVDARLRGEHGITLGAFQAILAIANSPTGSMRVGEIAQALGITAGATSKVVDRIEMQGLVERLPEEGDRRVSRIRLSDAGKTIGVVARQVCETEVKSILDAELSAEAQTQMHQAIQLMLARI